MPRVSLTWASSRRSSSSDTDDPLLPGGAAPPTRGWSGAAQVPGSPPQGGALGGTPPTIEECRPPLYVRPCPCTQEARDGQRGRPQRPAGVRSAHVPAAEGQAPGPGGPRPLRAPSPPPAPAGRGGGEPADPGHRPRRGGQDRPARGVGGRDGRRHRVAVPRRVRPRPVPAVVGRDRRPRPAPPPGGRRGGGAGAAAPRGGRG